MSYGDEAAERAEMDAPTELVRPDGAVITPDWKRLDEILWNGRIRDMQRTRDEAAQWRNKLWKFMEERAHRSAFKPYEICGAQDAWHPRHDEGHPEYDEDDLVAGVICQLPKDHQELGYRNHLEMDSSGKVWGAWG